MRMSDATVQVLRRFLADRDPRWLAEDVELHDPTRPSSCRGRIEAGAWWNRLCGEVFADAHLDMTRVTVDGSRAAVEWLFRGRHIGSLLGESPSGRNVALPMAGIFEVADGEIRGVDLYYDALGLLRQLGAPKSDTCAHP